MSCLAGSLYFCCVLETYEPTLGEDGIIFIVVSDCFKSGIFGFFLNLLEG